MQTRHLTLIGALATAIVASGCSAPSSDTSNASGAPSASGSAASSDSTSSAITALKKDPAAAAMVPKAIRSAGVVRVASGVSFPPMEYFASDNKTVLGFDPDLAKALGQVLGLDFKFQNTNFDGIIGGLVAGRYDLGMTSMNDKKSRQGIVDFVDYLSSGNMFMVAKGNPKKLNTRLDLCGKKAAVEKSTTGDLSVGDITKECTAAGKPAVNLLPFPDQASAVQALESGRADAVVALDLTLAYNVKQNPSSFELAGKPFDTLPIGIPIPKGDPALRNAVQAAMKKVISSGVYAQLLAKWSLQAQAIKSPTINAGT